MATELQRVFDKIDEVAGQVSDLRVGVKEIEMGQRALVNEVTQTREIATETNKVTVNCPARNEWTGLTRRLDLVERGRPSSVPSARVGSLALLKVFAPYILGGLAAVGVVASSYAQSRDASKAAEAAAAAADTAVKSSAAVSKVSKAVERIEKAIDTDEALKASLAE